MEDDIGGDALEDFSWSADEEPDDGDHEDKESAPFEPVPEDQRFCISLSLEQIYAAKVLAQAAKGNKSRRLLLEAYRRLIFAIFTSIPGDASIDPFKSPMEAFLIARGLNPDKSFKSAHSMSSGFSHVQYLGMFSIFSAGTAMWLTYGLLSHTWPVAVANGVTLVLSFSILVLKLRYDREAMKEVAQI